MKYLILNNLSYLFNRLAIAFLFFFLIYCVYFFSLPHIHIGIYTLNNPLQPFIDNLSCWLYLLLYVIAISIVNVFILMIMSLFYTIRNERQEAAKLKDQLFLTGKIIACLFNNEKNALPEIGRHFSAIRVPSRRKKAVEAFFSDIITVQENMEVDLNEKIRQMLTELKLIKYISVFLFSKRLDRRTIAMKMISCIKLKGHEALIRKYSRSRNYVLRTAALDTLIRLSETDHLESLLSHKHLITMLDINVIVHGIENNSKAVIDYDSLLGSDSSRIRVIGLLLLKIRNRSEYKDQIRLMLKSNDILLSETAFEVFISFAEGEEDVKFLIETYKNEMVKNKLQILKGIKFIDNDAFYDFIDNVIAEDEILLKIEALRILFRNNIKRFLPYESSVNGNILAAYNEVVDLNLI